MAVGQALDATVTTMAAARAIAPQLSSRAREGDELRTLPPDLVADLRDAGLFELATPRSLGGAELPPAAIVDVTEELCRADGSAGWSVLIGNSTAFLAWLEPSVAAELLARIQRPVGAAVFAPTGRLTAGAGNTFRLDGRWGFCSGSAHADLFMNGAIVHDGDQPRILPGRGPDWRLTAVPATAATVIDNWDAIGLRGTGSHDVVAGGLTVSAEHTFSPFFEPARHDGPLWRLPFFTLVGATLVGFPLGVARRALDELARFAPTKIRPPSSAPIAEDGDVQIAITRAEGGLQSARAFVMDALGELWETACLGDVPSDQQRARFLLATQQAMRAAVEAVDTAFGFGGVGALHADNPLQRCFRDIHAAAQHIYFSQAAAKRYAKARLGIDQPTFWF